MLRIGTRFYARAFATLACVLAALACAHASPRKPATTTLIAVGDISLARAVASQIRRRGAAYPLRCVLPMLRTADITFGNLECAVTDRASIASKRVNLIASPSAIAALRGVPRPVLGLANNHSFDAGPNGAVDTITALDKAGISHVGAGSTLAMAAAPVIMRVNGVTVAFVAFCDYPPIASSVAFMSSATTDYVRASVANARRRADVVVAGFHWGIEYNTQPTERQRALAREAVDAGADVVVGSHPHVLQPIERFPSPSGRRPALVAYSLGNFIFDARANHGTRTELLFMRVDKRGVISVDAAQLRLVNGRPEAIGKTEGMSDRNAIACR